MYACGLVQLAAAAASSLQVTVVGEFVVVNATEVLVVFRNALFAGEVIVTVGIDASDTENVRVADPELPAVSVAETTTVWLPFARPV